MSFFIRLVNRRVSWIEQPGKKLIINLLFFTLIFLPLNLIYVKLVFAYDPEIFNFWHLFLLNRHNALTAFIILLYFNSLNFFIAWKGSILEAKEIEKKHVEYQLQALKNQTNPHFLFNNLNVLSQLIHEDISQADEFINHFSEVYRYLLEQKEEDLVSIKTELEFLESYIFLVQIRHGANIGFKINWEKLKGFSVAPITLQMLIENAMKHNEISAKFPLIIEIDVQAQYMIVKNNVRPKSMVGYSSGIGLENIMSRYKLITGEDVIIKENADTFQVFLPIINKIKKLT
jgi:LytS/YehU family sensor histidine kinase